MNEERRKADRRMPPAVAQHAIEERAELLARIEEQAREIERLIYGNADLSSQVRELGHKMDYYKAASDQLAALKSRPIGVVLPDRANENEGNAYTVMQAMARNQTLDEVARLNSPLVSAGGVYSADPLACSGCVSGCVRCRVSAGVVDEREAFEADLHATLESMGITPNTVGGKRLIACCAAAVKRFRTSPPDNSDQVREVLAKLFDTVEWAANDTGNLFIDHELRDEVCAALTAQPDHSEHPDDAAVDQFAVAMKAKMAKSRDKGRHGWQNATAPHLSSLLYEHMYKGDPLDVANLAMMLHQNKQAIELPHDARRRPDHSEQSLNMVPDVIRDQHRKAMKLLREVRCWIIPKGNISMSIIERVCAFLDSAAPAPGKKEGE